MHRNCVPFLKIYLCIYRTDMFRLFPSHLQGVVIWYNVREQCVCFQDTVIYVSVLQLQFIRC